MMKNRQEKRSTPSSSTKLIKMRVISGRRQNLTSSLCWIKSSSTSKYMSGKKHIQIRILALLKPYPLITLIFPSTATRTKSTSIQTCIQRHMRKEHRWILSMGPLRSCSLRSLKRMKTLIPRYMRTQMGIHTLTQCILRQRWHQIWSMTSSQSVIRRTLQRLFYLLCRSDTKELGKLIQCSIITPQFQMKTKRHWVLVSWMWIWTVQCFQTHLLNKTWSVMATTPQCLHSSISET